MMGRHDQQPAAKGVESRRRYWTWAVLLAVILFAGGIRVRLRAVPLERDEGEYAYAGQLILEGVPPYAQAYNMKMPGIYYAYALLLAVFGQTHNAIHLGLLVVNVLTALLLFALARRLFGPLVGVAAAGAFALLSLGQWVQGIFANAEHFVILPALAGILLLLGAVDFRKPLLVLAAAVLLGLAFLMKQHGAAFIVFAGLYLFISELRHRPLTCKTALADSLLFLVGVLLPFAVICLVLWWSGVFGKFWFWTFEYARQYVSALSLSEGLYFFKMQTRRIVGSAVLLWVLAAIGLTSLGWNKKARGHRLFVMGFLVFSFLAVCPGLYFRPHYFILLLPAVALLAGLGVASVYDLFARSRAVLLTRVVPVLLALIVLFHTLYQQWNFFFVMSPTKASLTSYPYHPFPEAMEIARYIRDHSSGDDLIAVIGSEPQIYFYANRRSATGHIYTYALMEPHPYALRMQQEMIREIESAHPEFLVFVNVASSWLARPDSQKLIFTWFQQYQHKYYRLVGVIDVMRPGQTVYCWGEKAFTYLPKSNHWFRVFRRKNDDRQNRRDG